MLNNNVNKPVSSSMALPRINMLPTALNTSSAIPTARAKSVARDANSQSDYIEELKDYVEQKVHSKNSQSNGRVMSKAESLIMKQRNRLRITKRSTAEAFDSKMKVFQDLNTFIDIKKFMIQMGDQILKKENSSRRIGIAHRKTVSIGNYEDHLMRGTLTDRENMDRLRGRMEEFWKTKKNYFQSSRTHVGERNGVFMSLAGHFSSEGKIKNALTPFKEANEQDEVTQGDFYHVLENNLLLNNYETIFKSRYKPHQNMLDEEMDEELLEKIKQGLSYGKPDKRLKEWLLKERLEKEQELKRRAGKVMNLMKRVAKNIYNKNSDNDDHATAAQSMRDYENGNNNNNNINKNTPQTKANTVIHSSNNNISNNDQAFSEPVSMFQTNFGESMMLDSNRMHGMSSVNFSTARLTSVKDGTDSNNSINRTASAGQVLNKKELFAVTPDENDFRHAIPQKIYNVRYLPNMIPEQLKHLSVTRKKPGKGKRQGVCVDNEVGRLKEEMKEILSEVKLTQKEYDEDKAVFKRQMEKISKDYRKNIREFQPNRVESLRISNSREARIPSLERNITRNRRLNPKFLSVVLQTNKEPMY